MTTTGLVDLLRRRRTVIALVAALAALAVLGATWLQTRTYRAGASAIVVPGERVLQPADVLRSLDTLERRTVIATLARIPGATESRVAAANRLGIDLREMERYRTNAMVVPNTNIIRIEVDGPDPLQAANVANVMMDLTADASARLYRIYSVRALERAAPNPRAIRPNPRRNALVALLVGLFLGAIAGIALDRVRGDWFERLRTRFPIRHA